LRPSVGQEAAAVDQADRQLRESQPIDDADACRPGAYHDEIGRQPGSIIYLARVDQHLRAESRSRHWAVGSHAPDFRVFIERERSLSAAIAGRDRAAIAKTHARDT
jgi:hypothetical protein